MLRLPKISGSSIVGKILFHNEHLLTNGSFRETLEVFQTPKFKDQTSTWSQQCRFKNECP